MSLHISIVPSMKPVVPPVGASVSVRQYGDDYQVLGGPRACASGGCPGVMLLRDAPDTIFDKQWQFFLYIINQRMTIGAITALMGRNKALMNNTGVGDDSNPRANYLTGADLTYPPPRLDKLRTFGLNSHAGQEVYSLFFALRETVHSVRARSFAMARRALSEFATLNAYEVKTFDGNLPPPLKPGKVYPQRIEDVSLDDYLHTPEKNREMFLDCNNVKIKTDQFLAYGPFANGLIRDWIGDGKMHSFFPLVSKYRVLSPLRNWGPVIPAGSPFPNPFRQ